MTRHGTRDVWRDVTGRPSRDEDREPRRERDPDGGVERDEVRRDQRTGQNDRDTTNARGVP